MVKKTQDKTLFGVIVSTTQNGSSAKKEGLTQGEVLEEEERRNSRHSNHTSASSTPKSSPRVKKHKLKIGAFRNSELHWQMDKITSGKKLLNYFWEEVS